MLSVVKAVKCGWRSLINRHRGGPDCGRASLPTQPRTKVLLLECCRLLKLEGALNKGDVVLLLDCGFVYSELLSRLFWLCVFFSLVCSTHFLFNTK